jgi:hypothetical protein
MDQWQSEQPVDMDSDSPPGRLVEDRGQSDNDRPEEPHAHAHPVINTQVLVSVERGKDDGEDEDWTVEDLPDALD